MLSPGALLLLQYPVTREDVAVMATKANTQNMMIQDTTQIGPRLPSH